MRPRFIFGLALLLSACEGSAPPVQSPDAALNQPRPCTDVNTPPPGYQGPVSPYSRCADTSPVRVAPSGVHDYSTGQPPRAVRGN
ncbi:hypothetical protein [Magnetospirillum sp. 64-120]|uniref:hypothetical protein n=1 Tax=Magnetospirillum sp. 64-120 TaxID=1895778 RepID=UPI0025BE8D59|nr:hypothetical protein [Magnetospirillum sp. 64-120]